MTKLIILQERPLTMAEVKHELLLIKERDKELNFRASKTDDYLSQFCSLDAKRCEALKEKLLSLSIPQIKQEHIVKLIDLLPVTPNDVKMVLSSYQHIVLNQQNQKKIADTIKEFI